MTNYTRKAVYGASIALIFSFLAAVIAYVTRIILARNLTPKEYGLFYAVFTLIIFFLFFRDWGLGQALVRHVAEFKVLKQYDRIKTAIVAVFSIQLSSSLLMGATFFFLADYLADHYFKNPLAAPVLKIMVLYILFSILFITTKQIFQGVQEMFLYSSVELSKNIIVLLLILSFFGLGLKLFAPVLAFALVCPLLFLIYLPTLLKKFNFFQHKVVDFKLISRQLFLFSIPVFLTDIGGQIVGYIDTLMLTYFVSLSEVGVYNVVLPSALIFFFFSKAVGTVLFPLSTELWIKKDTLRLSTGMALLHKYLFVVITPVILTAFFYAKFFIITLFGEEYVGGYPALQILLVGVLFYVVASANHNFLAGIGKPKIVTVIILLSALLNVLLNIFLIPRWGINGAALATTASYFLMLLISTYKTVRYVKSVFPWKEWILLIFPAFSFLGIIYMVESVLHLTIWLEIIISTSVGILMYALLTYLFGLLNFEEIKHYWKLVGRK